jgi:hypothetical protein
MTERREYRWRKTDESIVLIHCPDHEQSFLFYARTYTSRQGYQFSPTNQLILNFKIKPSEIRQNPKRLHYKQQAIRQFAAELITLLRDRRDSTQALTLVPMPPSKVRSDAEYDDRMEQVARAVAVGLEGVSWLPLLSIIQNIESYHQRTEGRDPDQLYALMQIEPSAAAQYQPHSVIILIDDVLTSGAHFTAARQRIQERFPEATVIGIFWAKAIAADELSS